MTNPCVHLTNSAINKTNTNNYGARNQDPFSGDLWTLGKLNQPSHIYNLTC